MTRQEAQDVLTELIPTATNTIVMSHQKHIGTAPLDMYYVQVFVGVPAGESKFYATSFEGWQDCIDSIREQVAG